MLSVIHYTEHHVAKPKNTVPAARAVEPRLLQIKDAAAYLSATVWFLRTLAWERKIAFVRAGHRLLFDKKDLDAFIERAKEPARA